MSSSSPGGKTAADGTLAAHDTRPISVLSAWWRSWTSGVARSPWFREWVDAWAPASYVGDRRGHTAHEALLGISEATAEDHYAGSADLLAAFDHIVPARAMWLARRLGLNDTVAGTIERVWSGQRRVLQLGRTILPQEVAVAASIPQGEAVSVAGMA